MASADACYVGPVSTSLLGSGSRGPVLLGTLGGTLVAVKLIFADPEASALDGVSASTTMYPIPPLRVVEEPAAAHATRVLARGSSAECEVEVRALAEGGELLDLVAEDGALPPEDAARYTMQAAIAVAHSHAAGLASGQLRLEHVLRDARGDVLLIGLRHRLDPSAEPGEEQTATVARASPRPPAPPPAPLRPARALDPPEWHAAGGGRSAVSREELPAADVWGLGLLLATLLRGQPPSASDDSCLALTSSFASARLADPQAAAAAAVGAAAAAGAAGGRAGTPSNSGAAGGAPAASLASSLERLAVAMLRPDPAQRPTAAAVARDLAALLERSSLGTAPGGCAAAGAGAERDVLAAVLEELRALNECWMQVLQQHHADLLPLLHHDEAGSEQGSGPCLADTPSCPTTRRARLRRRTTCGRGARLPQAGRC
mmetsp:Transcript_4024/g.13242  ORF Transcript_4024/g.13242 Transcript_4024/m.13242 type:complete len:431 (-) Transcript_4024:1190-2482(-)